MNAHENDDKRPKRSGYQWRHTVGMYDFSLFVGKNSLAYNFYFVKNQLNSQSNLRRLLVTANVASSPSFVTMIIEGRSSSETSA
jgi:hypothetical protein